MTEGGSDTDASESMPAESSMDDIPRADANAAASVAMALGHRLRMQILCRLTPLGEDGLSAGTLSAQLAVVPSSLSFHLQQMTKAGIITARHEGRSIFYSVNRSAVVALLNFLGGLLLHL
jgi:DNA-binding transcriptional ArsR family regulator